MCNRENIGVLLMHTRGKPKREEILLPDHKTESPYDVTQALCWRKDVGQGSTYRDSVG
jgi:hypothetical protein